ncbi:MAG: membrane dipeptidase [Clostridia bacterium]|nr:membrane dipeptidase [Clostridia bacterium]
MPSLPLFDLHCDTLYECVKQNKSLTTNDLQLSFDRLSRYERFCQILAMWSDYRISENTAWQRFFDARARLDDELRKNPRVRLCTDDASLRACEADGVNAVFLAVEGGKLLGSDLSRLDELHRVGVRFLTLVWNKTCAIGGAHDTDEGLTPFGYAVVKRCHELGIVPDLSHASALMCDQVLDLCKERGKICIATHSNAKAVCDHRRNLRDDQFRRIAALGGIVGISLAPMHLTDAETCTVDDVVRHIEHYLSLGGEDTVCLGCDLDGVDCLPDGIGSVSELTKIAEKLGQNNYSDNLIQKIFYANARNFISLWLN